MEWKVAVYIFVFFSYVLAFFAIIQCLLKTKYPQAALAWCGVILMLPFIGAILFFIFGVNRIDSKASKLFLDVANARLKHLESLRQKHWSHTPTTHNRQDFPIMNIGERRQGLACVGGNSIVPLFNGDEAYPKMLEAIQNATNHVFVSTYIYGGKKMGAAFTDALIEAYKRGVDVRVIVDGVGSFFSFRKWKRKLEKAGVSVFLFIPPRLFPLQIAINLRNHRKLLVCDDIAFTGGMNISDGNLVLKKQRSPVQDVHFCCKGPIISALREAFLLDYAFVTKQEQLMTYDEPQSQGNMDARMIMDGPGTDDDPILNTLCGVFSSAKKEILIINPYFLPTREIIISLISAVSRGVRVRVILPAKLDHVYVGWAADHIIPTMLNEGIEFLKQPAPFAHTKLVLIDEIYSFLGSTNFDPRSLKLNFELNLEVFSEEFNAKLVNYAKEIMSKSIEVKQFQYLVEHNSFLGFLKRLRNASAWIFSPYL